MDAESPKDSITDMIDFSSTFSPEETPLSTPIVTQSDTGLTTTVSDAITFSIANLNYVSTSTMVENPVSITIVTPYDKGLITTGTNQDRITSDNPTSARLMINADHSTKETVTENYNYVYDMTITSQTLSDQTHNTAGDETISLSDQNDTVPHQSCHHYSKETAYIKGEHVCVSNKTSIAHEGQVAKQSLLRLAFFLYFRIILFKIK
jgi:hypothetical protein